MNYKRFIEITKHNWSDYFKWLQKVRSEGQITFKENLDIFFPTILLITKTKDFFIAEFIGASREFQGLTIKGHTETSLNRYLYQFNLTTTDPVIILGSFFKFDGMGFMRDADVKKVISRFPFVSPERLTLNYTGPGEGAFLHFPKESKITHFSHCLFVNTYQSLNRVKDVLLMTVAHDDLIASEYETWLKKMLTSNRGWCI